MLQRNGPRENKRANDRGGKRGRTRLELPRTVAELAERYPRLLARVAAVGRLSSIDEAAVILRDAIALRKNYSEWVLTEHRADAMKAIRTVLFGSHRDQLPD
jgi:hypothetical protein